MNLLKAKEKAKALVMQMTAEEKISQLLYSSPEIERLGIKEYNWWNEASHGVARAGIATVFPHVIGLAATFNPELVKEVAEVVSTEGRAKYNKSVEFGDRDINKGLTYWTPNINIFRDPRWGRGQETFGEDPYLTATMGVSFIKGLQGEGEFLKSAACAKHYAVHSGPEKLRHEFNAEVDEKDLWETYLPAFEYAVKANVAGVMGAYNRTNGKPCCASEELMGDILRTRWGFDGYYVSDCGAIKDIFEKHRYTDSIEEAVAAALRNGCDLNCGFAYQSLIDAYEMDLITEEELTESAIRVFTTRALLGEFEENRPFSDIPLSVVDCKEHRQLNLEAARETLVLLKNENSFLPLNVQKKQRIAVVGPNGISTIALEGNYNGHASEYVTVAEGIRRVFKNAEISVAEGSRIYHEAKNSWNGFWNLRSEGLAAASEADITVLCLGLNRTFEGEETDSGSYGDFSDGGDRKTLHLPQTQMRLAEAVCDVCENVVVVVLSGSATDLGEKVRKHAKAIIHAWYPGALGGLAIAELLAGVYSPSGKLPLTFYSEQNTLPEITDYSMKGRTYRYMKETPLYPFGFGLSYTDFRYDDFKILSSDKERLEVEVTLTNRGEIEGVEKVQVYAKFSDERTETPNYQLCGVKAVHMLPNETKKVKIGIDCFWIKAVLADGNRVEPTGQIVLYAGGHQPDKYSEELCKYPCLDIELKR